MSSGKKSPKSGVISPSHKGNVTPSSGMFATFSLLSSVSKAAAELTIDVEYSIESPIDLFICC